MAVIHWFRRDLRLRDNTALAAALSSGEQVIPLFIFDPAIMQGERFGLPRFAVLLKALASLDRTLQCSQSGLLIRYGNPLEVLPEVVAQTGATTLYFNRDYTPYALKRDQQISSVVRARVIPYDDVLIHAPGEVEKAEGGAYTVFTPFYNRWRLLPKPIVVTPQSRPGQFHSLEGLKWYPIPTLADFGGAVTIDVPDAYEALAQHRLHEFVEGAVFHYAETRNRLVTNPFSDHPPVSSSYLSPYLRLGLLSPRQAYQAAQAAMDQARTEAERKSVEAWIRELAWRDFYAHILYFFPHVLQRSFREQFDRVEYRNDSSEFQCWQDGQTGYPIVDAAMRQLNAIGWMPNRARMVVSSFLTRDLLIYWKNGDIHFMQHLIDGDPAVNNGNWQWASGTGTDPQPTFRIFNPVAQSRQFDPEGHYIRHFVPELRDVPAKEIHAPWVMTNPPKHYPPPIVDHVIAREHALQAFKAAKDQ